MNHSRNKRRDRFMNEKYDENKIQEMLSDMKENIGGVVKDLMLPEGQSMLLGSVSEESEREQLLRLSASVDPDAIVSLLKEEVKFVSLPNSVESNSSSLGNAKDDTVSYSELTDRSISDTLTELGVDIHHETGLSTDPELSEDEINIALGKLLLHGRNYEASEIFNMLTTIDLEPSPLYLNLRMSILSGHLESRMMNEDVRSAKIKEIFNIFDTIVRSGIEPDTESWSYRVYALAHSRQPGHGPDAALSEIQRLKGLSIPIDVRCYNGVLESLILRGDSDPHLTCGCKCTLSLV